MVWGGARRPIHTPKRLPLFAKTIPAATQKNAFDTAGLPLPVDVLGEVIHSKYTHCEKGFAALRKM